MELSRIYRGCPPKGKPSLEKDWYVEFGEDRKQIKKGINRHKTIEGREKAARELKAKMDMLIVQEVKKPEKSSITVLEGYQWAYDKLKPEWGKAHAYVHKSRKKYFDAAIEGLKLTKLKLKDFTRLRMREVLEWIKINRNLSKYSYISYKEMYHIIFSVLVEWEKTDVNPCDFRVGFRKPPAKPKIILDEDERVRVRKHISEADPAFFNYLMLFYHTSMRPVEIMRLRVDDLRKAKDYILLKADQAKDKEDRMIFIPDVLWPYINALELDKYPSHWFVFGLNFKPQERKKHRASQEASNLWRDLVKIGLGIDKDMYWLKDQAMREKRIAKIPKDAIKDQAGHATWKQSEVYAGKHLPEDVEKLKKNTKDF